MTEPITVYESSFDPGRLLMLRTRNSAACKGIYALLMKGGSKDWLDRDRKAVSDTKTPTLPEDYDLEDEEPADEDVIEAEAAA